jgi:tryptophanyl-tRNA synthetase
LLSFKNPGDPENLNYGWVELGSNGNNPGVSVTAGSGDINQTTWGDLTGWAWNASNDNSGLGWLSVNCLTGGSGGTSTCGISNYKLSARPDQPSITSLTPTSGADILIYKPESVPVGEDQTQHVELARVVARKFNNRFGQTFPEPHTFLKKSLRIMSLTEPTKKMSKTGDEALMLDDSPTEISRKIKKAVTASEVGKKSPGEENLMFLLSHFGSAESVKYFSEAQNSGKLKYSELKETLAKNITEYFAEFRERKKELLAKPNYIAEVLGEGAEKARAVAQTTLLEVKQKIGLL